VLRKRGRIGILTRGYRDSDPEIGSTPPLSPTPYCHVHLDTRCLPIQVSRCLRYLPGRIPSSSSRRAPNPSPAPNPANPPGPTTKSSSPSTPSPLSHSPTRPCARRSSVSSLTCCTSASAPTDKERWSCDAGNWARWSGRGRRGCDGSPRTGQERTSRG
jgi:hypothetical protein